MKSGTIVATLALVLALGVSSGAQSRKWEEPYRKGVQAFEAGKYADAREQLERAIAAEPKAEANKLIEGVYRTDYFPYYYLALTFVELQQFDKAQQNLDKARPTVMRWQQARFAEAESKIKIALAKPPQPQRNAEFDNGVRDANALLSGKQFDAAIRRFDQLRAADAAEYGKAGLAARRDEAAKGLAGQLIDEARTLVQNGRLRDAAARLRQADQTLPGQKPVGDLQAEIKKREEDYQRLKTEGQAAFSGKNYAAARDKFDQARQAHPEQFDADNLVARLSEASTLANTAGRAGRGPDIVVPDGGPKAPAIPPGVTEGRRIADLARRLIEQGKYAEADAAYASALKADAKNQEAVEALEKAKRFKASRDQGLQLSKAKKAAAAQKALIDARNVDAGRFAREGLASTLDALAASNDRVDNGQRGADQDRSKVALHDALLALLNGDAEKSIAVLEPAVSTGGDRTAALHAYLGVAYATRSLSAPKPEDQVRLHQKAVEQFKLAASAQPGYRLSDRVVSPAIVKIYEQSR
jgi:hypothetical protein